MKRVQRFKEKRSAIKAIVVLLFISFIACEPEEDLNRLSVTTNEIDIPAEGGTATFNIETDADSWNVDNPASDWISIPMTSGVGSEAMISVTVDSKTLVPRTDTLTITAGNAKTEYVVVSQEASEYLFYLNTNLPYETFTFAGGSKTMKITSEAPEWNLTCDSSWIELSQYTGGEGVFNVDITVKPNAESSERSAIIYLTGEGAPTKQIAITQNGGFPNYNTDPIDPDMTGMSSSAVEIASKITIGWNIGNTLEAMGGETAWGNPMVTDELIKLVKANGFNAIRIPCSWDQYLESSKTVKIKASWLNRVKEVVQYCVDNDMYVLLNIHWDGGWLEKNCVPGQKAFVNAKQKALWEQIATHLRDFDEHLMFASANEPDVVDATGMSVLNTYHQTFVDAVRSTGGKNSYRVLVVQGPRTNTADTYKLMNTMPTDQVEGRMMAEVHYYEPYQYCLLTEDVSWGKMFYYWGADFHSTTDAERNASWGEEAFLDQQLALMKTKFVDKGIPVILGEFAVIRRTDITGENGDLHKASRLYYLKYLMQKSKENGLLPFYWDVGDGNRTNTSGLFDRNNYTVFDQEAIDALMEGISK